MTTHVQEIAGNLTLVIPKGIAAQAHVSGGSEVDLQVAAGSIIVRPVARPSVIETGLRKKSLQELLALVTDENRHSETQWGSPVGNEVW